MLIVRKAISSDQEAVFRIVKERDLEYPGLALDHFWVAEQDGEVVAAARMEESREFCFLSALGTSTAKQGRGIASKLLQRILEACDKDAYLYTVIPEFFIKFGFEPTTMVSGLPARGRFNCETCEPEKCVCMRRRSRK